MTKTSNSQSSHAMVKEFHITATSEDKTAVDYLAESTGMSKQKLKQYMQKGCVWLERKAIVDEETSLLLSSLNDTVLQSEAHTNTQSYQGYIQRLRRAKKTLNEGDVLHFYYNESVLLSEPAAATLVEDCGDYSVWNKPSGMLSQGSKWGDHCTVYRWAEKNLQPERAAFIVHRLDRAANGLIILAHKKSIASRFSRLFETRDIEKRYWVKVQGDFSKKITVKESLFTINDRIDGKAAISHVSFLSYDVMKNTSTVEVEIETGRKHQIRKHLSQLGFPVVGDRLYGADSIELPQYEGVDLQLQAKMLKFTCPISSTQKVFIL